MTKDASPAAVEELPATSLVAWWYHSLITASHWLNTKNTSQHAMEKDISTRHGTSAYCSDWLQAILKL